MSPSELQSLIQHLLDGEISAEEFATLEAELSQNPEALETYRAWVGLHCGLQRHAMRHSAIAKLPVVPIDRVLILQRQRIVRISLLVTAAVLLVSAVALWITQSPSAPQTLADFRAAPGSSFTLSHSGDGKRPLAGKLSDGSKLVLDHGMAEIDLPHDVRAIIEAPASLTLIDGRTVDLDRGRAFFEVPTPDGRGFIVITPNQKIVDLGTAFGVDLPIGSDQTHLHVFSGSVRIDGLNAEGTGEVIRAPMAVAIRGIRVEEQLDATADRFRRRLPDRVERILVEDFESGLQAEKNYAIHMDSTAIVDQAGNRFDGISEKDPWRFSTSKELQVLNPGFEIDDPANKAPLHWREVSGVQVLFNTYAESPKATEGSLRLLVPPDRTVVQELDAPIRAGTTYQLILDVGNCPARFPSQAVVQFYGSDAGHEAPLAEIRVAPPENAWVRHQILTFSAAPKDATGQTLGIALSSKDGFSSFDDLRIFATHGVDQAVSPGSLSEEVDRSGQTDPTPPFLSSFDPAPDASHVPLNATPTLVFDEPVDFGTGRIIVRNLTDASESELIVGSEHTSLSGRILTFLPPLGLKDGTSQIGGIPGWVSSGPVSRFNPSADDHRYRHPDLADDSKARGILDSMKGPTLATLGTKGLPGTIRRSLGPVEEGRTYTVSVGIGSRSHDAAEASPFAGYRIRLLCDSVVLSEISGKTPPGPPNSVMPVGFSWDSLEFPDHLAADTPLVLEISSFGEPNHDGGYLDIDHVQVSSFGGVER